MSAWGATKGARYRDSLAMGTGATCNGATPQGSINSKERAAPITSSAPSRKKPGATSKGARDKGGHSDHWGAPPRSERVGGSGSVPGGDTKTATKEKLQDDAIALSKGTLWSADKAVIEITGSDTDGGTKVGQSVRLQTRCYQLCRVSGASWLPQEVSQLGYIVNTCK